MAEEKKKKMGAPRKPNPNETYEPKQLGVLTDTAFGLAKLPDGKNILVKIKYNPLTGGVGSPEIQITSENMSNAEYEFREMVDEYIDLEFISKA